MKFLWCFKCETLDYSTKNVTNKRSIWGLVLEGTKGKSDANGTHKNEKSPLIYFTGHVTRYSISFKSVYLKLTTYNCNYHLLFTHTLLL